MTGIYLAYSLVLLAINTDHELATASKEMSYLACSLSLLGRWCQWIRFFSLSRIGSRTYGSITNLIRIIHVRFLGKARHNRQLDVYERPSVLYKFDKDSFNTVNNLSTIPPAWIMRSREFETEFQTGLAKLLLMARYETKRNTCKYTCYVLTKSGIFG